MSSFIPDVIEHFSKMREENPTDRKGKYFYVPAEEIKGNNYELNISRYREIEYEEVEYEKPEVIIQRIEEIEEQIKTNIAELKKLLNEK